MYINKR